MLGSRHTARRLHAVNDELEDEETPVVPDGDPAADVPPADAQADTPESAPAQPETDLGPNETTPSYIPLDQTLIGTEPEAAFLEESARLADEIRAGVDRQDLSTEVTPTGIEGTVIASRQDTPMDLWAALDAPSPDHQAHTAAVSSAHSLAFAYWPDLAAAISPSDFENRLAIFDQKLTSLSASAARATNGDPVAVHADLVRQLHRDYLTMTGGWASDNEFAWCDYPGCDKTDRGGALLHSTHSVIYSEWGADGEPSGKTYCPEHLPDNKPYAADVAQEEYQFDQAAKTGSSAELRGHRIVCPIHGTVDITHETEGEPTGHGGTHKTYDLACGHTMADSGAEAHIVHAKTKTASSGEADICTDCLMWIANGDSSGQSNYKTDDEIAQWENDWAERNKDTRWVPGDDTESHFSMSPCAACGSNLGGDRESAHWESVGTTAAKTEAPNAEPMAECLDCGHFDEAHHFKRGKCPECRSANLDKYAAKTASSDPTDVDFYNGHKSEALHQIVNSPHHPLDHAKAAWAQLVRRGEVEGYDGGLGGPVTAAKTASYPEGQPPAGKIPQLRDAVWARASQAPLVVGDAFTITSPAGTVTWTVSDALSDAVVLVSPGFTAERLTVQIPGNGQTQLSANDQLTQEPMPHTAGFTGEPGDIAIVLEGNELPAVADIAKMDGTYHLQYEWDGLIYTVFYAQHGAIGDNGQPVSGDVTGEYEVLAAPVGDDWLVGAKDVLRRLHVSPHGTSGYGNASAKGYAANEVQATIVRYHQAHG